MRRWWKWAALFGCALILEFLPGPTLSEEFWTFAPWAKIGAGVFAAALLLHLFLGWWKRL